MAENKWTTLITCPRHPNADLVEDYHAGDMICPECGLVVGDRCVLCHMQICTINFQQLSCVHVGHGLCVLSCDM